MTTNTAELIVRLGQLKSQLEEAAARGFRDNARAMNVLTELKDTVDRLEELAAKEYWA
jgi:hypothetical protein